MLVDAVIEGGGIKAIGLVGAIFEAEKRGYQWNRLAGTSAGSMIAAMLAAGYTASELKDEFMNLDYKKFIQKKGIEIPFLGAAFNLIFKLGIHSGDYIEQWLSEKLRVKGVRAFGDLEKTLYIIASDITSGEMLVLPQDLTRYGVDPLTFDIARAVRMSSSLPFYFQPVKFKGLYNKKLDHYIVDGGLLSNFPVWIFDDDGSSKWPTFGFRLVSEKTGQPNKINGPISLGYSLISTMVEAHDTRHIKEKDYVRSILVPTLGVNTTDFDLNKEKRDELFESGVKAAKNFFDQWNYIRYTFQYRQSKKTP
ncbi:MAG: patatin-like phospholipase family protein [Tepidibacillus sp.]